MSNSDPIRQCDNYDTKIAKQTPITIDVMKRDTKAIVASLYVARETIDNMHPNERKVHTFDRHDIRDIEKRVRGKINQLDFTGKPIQWRELELQKDEIIAIQQGLTDVLFSDSREQTDNMKRLSNLLTHELTV